MSPTELIQTIAEPTRLRILNCLAAAPLFVSDLQSLLGLPQSTVSRHLQVLRRAELVRDTPVTPFVIYRLRHPLGASGQLLGTVLETIATEAVFGAERDAAHARSRSNYFDRTSEEPAMTASDGMGQANEGGTA
ncbi:MAG: metalloregulator ArsR/SmtB family transcription factor [Gemmatimonadales bacterium]|nr:metalloregulator ArsR/SmtB family transcription factor [Gemmatimonadales bacterium]